ncbi:MAG: hypothetical protein OIF57_15470 [Marinobacterium sp.]|nr:hypothetical protein [Marinobacterium sp.]
MTRQKKRRHTREWVEFEDGPSRKDKLSNPDSYESRKRKAKAEQKKNRSVFQKVQDAKAAANGGQKENSHARGRLADKIRKLNAQNTVDSND